MTLSSHAEMSIIAGVDGANAIGQFGAINGADDGGAFSLEVLL